MDMGLVLSFNTNSAYIEKVVVCLANTLASNQKKEIKSSEKFELNTYPMMIGLLKEVLGELILFFHLITSYMHENS